MREAKFDIEQALRRRLNWGKSGETSGQNLSENSIIDEVGNRFTSLKKKISYRDRVIAESRETISNQKAIITAKESAINTKDTRIKELEEENAKAEIYRQRQHSNTTLNLQDQLLGQMNRAQR